MKRIVITGPESSGKTTLTRRLATLLDAPYAPEYARIYLAAKGTTYTVDDIVNIAIGQCALVESIEAATTNKLAILIDTWMLELKIWSQYRFGVVPDTIISLYQEHSPDFYVLCTPDLTWEPDPLRETPHDRDVLYKMYEEHVIASNIPFVKLRGQGEGREQMALRSINRFLSDLFDKEAIST